MLALLALSALGVGGCTGGEARREREQKVARAEMAQAETTAKRAASLSATGLWSQEHLLDRLVRAGVAPRVVTEAPAGPEWMRVRAVSFLAGGGTLYVWIYPDSTARRAVTEGLDPATAAPPGVVTPFAPPMRLITQNNIAVVITGGAERNQERVALAVQAGLPVREPEPR